MAFKIIVNADDLGISDSVNSAIFQGMQRGTITSATMLANGPAVEAAARELHRFPQCSFGIHLNLTELEPVWAESRTDLRAILDAGQCFNGNSIRRVHIGVPMLRAIFREWCAQIEVLKRLGVEPSHFDGHHHVHTIPQLLPVLAKLKKRYGINKIRISRNMYDEVEYPGKSLLIKKWAFNSALRAVGFETTQIFTDMVTFIKLSAARPPRLTSAELMTHPGSSPRSEEADLLENEWPRKLAYDVSLVSYKSL